MRHKKIHKAEMNLKQKAVWDGGGGREEECTKLGSGCHVKLLWGENTKSLIIFLNTMG